MSLYSYKKIPQYFNKVVLTPVVSAAGWKVAAAAAGTRLGEVLVCIKGLTTKNAVAYPTFVMSQPATVHYTTGQVLTLTVTASKAVQSTGATTINLDINGTNRSAVFNPVTSTDTVLKFDYTFVAGDVAVSSIVIAAAMVPEAGHGVTMAIDTESSEIVPDASLIYTPIATSNVTVN